MKVIFDEHDRAFAKGVVKGEGLDETAAEKLLAMVRKALEAQFEYEAHYLATYLEVVA